MGVRRITGIAAILLLAAAMASPAGAQGRDRREITKTFPAANLQGFSVEARVGEVRVRATNANEVSLRLEIESKPEDGGWFSRDRRGDPNAVELDAYTGGVNLRLSLRGERRGLLERWTLTVPARFEASVKLDVGDLELRGLEGGVRLRVNVGNMDLEIPRGAIDAEVNVGDLRARTASQDYGDVHLESNVGDATLRVDSRRVESRGKRRYGPGEDVRWSGTGRHRIRMEVNVGDASLEIAKSG